MMATATLWAELNERFRREILEAFMRRHHGSITRAAEEGKGNLNLCLTDGTFRK